MIKHTTTEDSTPLGTINGIGYKFYGHADPMPDRSYIATKWGVLLWIPIYPVGSFRVTVMDSKWMLIGSSTTYHSVPVPLNKKRVIKTYGVVATIVVGFLILWLLS